MLFEQRSKGNMMHVAFVTSEFIKDGRIYPGGLSTYIYETSKELIALGDTVSVFMVSDRSRIHDFEGIKVFEVLCRTPFVLRPLMKILSLKLPRSVHMAMSSLHINRYVAKRMAHEKIDILHYTNWKAIGLFRIGGRSLVRISSYERLWDNNPTNVDLDKILSRWLESFAIKRFRTIIGPGAYLASIIKKELHLNSEIRIIPTPTRPSLPIQGRTYGLEGKRLIMYAGTVSRIKGSELLFGIIDRYLSEYDDTVFLVAGKAGTADGRSVKESIDSLSRKHPRYLIYHPNLEKPDLQSAYRHADLVLITSLIDNFPNTALEAASHGALIMSTDTASLDSLLEDGKNAFVMHSRRPSDWVVEMRRVFSLESERLIEMKERMRLKLIDHEPRNAVLKLKEVYKELMDGKN